MKAHQSEYAGILPFKSDREKELSQPNKNWEKLLFGGFPYKKCLLESLTRGKEV